MQHKEEKEHSGGKNPAAEQKEKSESKEQEISKRKGTCTTKNVHCHKKDVPSWLQTWTVKLRFGVAEFQREGFLPNNDTFFFQVPVRGKEEEEKKKLSRRGLSLRIERHLENNLCGGIVVIKGGSSSGRCFLGGGTGPRKCNKLFSPRVVSLSLWKGTSDGQNTFFLCT